MSKPGAERGRASEHGDGHEAEEQHNSAAGHERHSLEAEDPYTDFIQGRGGLCIAKEVGMHVHATPSITVCDRYQSHMQAGTLLATLLVHASPLLMRCPV